MNLRYLTEAREDAVEIASYLDDQSQGLGHEFRAELRTAIDDIQDRPRLFPRIEDARTSVEVREFHITRFHYRVIYAVLESESVLVAIIHTSRRPGFWRQRLRQISRPQ